MKSFYLTAFDLTDRIIEYTVCVHRSFLSIRHHKWRGCFNIIIHRNTRGNNISFILVNHVCEKYEHLWQWAIFLTNTKISFIFKYRKMSLFRMHFFTVKKKKKIEKVSLRVRDYNCLLSKDIFLYVYRQLCIRKPNYLLQNGSNS